MKKFFTLLVLVSNQFLCHAVDELQTGDQAPHAVSPVRISGATAVAVPAGTASADGQTSEQPVQGCWPRVGSALKKFICVCLGATANATLDNLQKGGGVTVTNLAASLSSALLTGFLTAVTSCRGGDEEGIPGRLHDHMSHIFEIVTVRMSLTEHDVDRITGFIVAAKAQEIAGAFKKIADELIVLQGFSGKNFGLLINIVQGMRNDEQCLPLTRSLAAHMLIALEAAAADLPGHGAGVMSV